MTLLAPKMTFTPEEYLSLEIVSEEKHEYDRGLIVAMAGASNFHNFISINLVVLIGSRLWGSPCRPLGSDQRLKVSDSGRYTYPDLMIQCGKPEYDPLDSNTLINPTVVIEVLSDSTFYRDQHEKLRAYQQIPSVKEIALVSQMQPLATVYSRTPEGFWLVKHYEDLTGMFTLESVGVSIPLADVYRDVEFQTFPPKTDAE